jgi:hypothetical protein
MPTPRPGLPGYLVSSGLHTSPYEGGIRGWGLVDRLGTRQQILDVRSGGWPGFALDGIGSQLQAPVSIVALQATVTRACRLNDGANQPFIGMHRCCGARSTAGPEFWRVR